MSDKVVKAFGVVEGGAKRANDVADKLYNDVWDVLETAQENADGQILNATVIGILEMVKQDILNDARED